MFRILTCLTAEHDWRLVLLADLVCFVASIAAVNIFHRATASRWVNAARDALGEHLREQVAKRLAIPVEEVDSIVRLVQSQVEVSLARIL